MALLLLCWRCFPRLDASAARRGVIPVACALGALVLHLRADRVGRSTLYAAATCGTLLVGHPAAHRRRAVASGEMLYAWLALYAAYFFPSARRPSSSC